MVETIQLKRGLKPTWESLNPVLKSGELGVVFDPTTLLPIGVKIGNGSNTYNELPFLGGSGDEYYTKEEINRMLSSIELEILDIDDRISTIELNLDKIKIGKDLISLERLGDYLYKATFENIPEFKEIYDTPVIGCTSFVRGGRLYRNLDLNYDNMATFWVKCKGFEGMAYIHGVDEGFLDKKYLEQLPYHLLDGRNNFGIRVSTHLLYNDWEFSGSGNKDFPLYLLPYKILSNVTKLTSTLDLQAQLNQFLENVKIYSSLSDKGYLLQFLVTDGTKTFIIIPPIETSDIYRVIEATAGIERLTNFRYVPVQILERNSELLQLRPMGIERWNLINQGVSLEDLRFTQAYTSNTRLSEFIGINETTKYSSDNELEAIYQIAHQWYLERERDGKTWQTVYSIIYSADRVEALYTQENYNINYVESNNLIKTSQLENDGDGYSPYVTNNQLVLEKGTGINSIQQKGSLCEATGDNSVAEGLNTHAGATASHSEGALTATRNDYDEETETGFDAAYSHVEGLNNATNNIAEHGEGKYGYSYYADNHDPSKCSIHYVGIGTNNQDAYRKNAEVIMANGDKYILGIGEYNGKNIEGVKTLQEVVNNKVDKEEGKGLSTNDFTNEYKNSLDDIKSGFIRDFKINNVSRVDENKDVNLFFYSNNGVTISSDGTVKIYPANENDIKDRLDGDPRRVYQPLIPKDINEYVKAGLTDENHLTLNKQQQATAQQVLGIKSYLDLLEETEKESLDDITDEDITEELLTKFTTTNTLKVNGNRYFLYENNGNSFVAIHYDDDYNAHILYGTVGSFNQENLVYASNEDLENIESELNNKANKLTVKSTGFITLDDIQSTAVPSLTVQQVETIYTNISNQTVVYIEDALGNSDILVFQNAPIGDNQNHSIYFNYLSKLLLTYTIVNNSVEITYREVFTKTDLESKFAPLSFVSNLYGKLNTGNIIELVDTAPAPNNNNILQISGSTNTEYDWNNPSIVFVRKIEVNTTLVNTNSLTFTLKYKTNRNVTISWGAKIQYSTDNLNWEDLSNNQSFNAVNVNANDGTSTDITVFTNAIQGSKNISKDGYLRILLFKKLGDAVSTDISLYFGVTVDNAYVGTFARFNFDNIEIDTAKIKDGSVTKEKLSSTLINEIESKLDSISSPNKIYGTDNSGNQSAFNKNDSVSDTPSSNNIISELGLTNYIVSGNNGDPKTLTNVDLNTITATGFYFCNICTNRPVTANGILIVSKMSGGNSYVAQMYMAFAEDKVFVRFKDNNVWKSWRNISDIDLTNYVQNTDYATTDKGGVFKSSTSYANAVNSAGSLYAQIKTYLEYQSLDSSAFIGKGTLENVIVGKGLISQSDADGRYVQNALNLTVDI